MASKDLEHISFSLEKEIKKFEREKVKQKELQKNLGVIYTPQKIADFMVRQALKLYFSDLLAIDQNSDFEKLLSIIAKNQNIKNNLINIIQALKILDPACGTGRFLISIAKNLLLIYKNLYPDMLDYDIKRNIIKRNLFGVDIELSAIKISRLRLIKWLLSGLQREDNFKLQVDDIEEISEKCGIVFNFYNTDFLLDFNLSNFDLIIGNPPYIENKKIFDKNYKKQLTDRFSAAYRLYDLSILFIEKSLEVLKQNKGILSFLTTNKFLAADYGVKIREMLVNKVEIKEIIDLSSIPVFQNIAAYPIIINLRNRTPKNGPIILKKIRDLHVMENEISTILDTFQQNSINLLPERVIPLSKNLNLVKYLYKNYKPMAKVIPDLKIVYRPYGFINWSENFNHVSEKPASNRDLLLIGTGNVGKFHINFKKPIRIAQRKLNICYFNYNQIFEPKWNGLSVEKLIFREIAKDLTFAFDPGIFTNITGLYFIVIPSYNINQMFSLMLVLNSDLINLVFKTLFGTLHMAGNYLRINGSFIKRLPLPKVLPTSISTLGKVIQFLSQLKSDFFELNRVDFLNGIEISLVEKVLTFYKEISNSIINGLYLSKENQSSDYENLFNSIDNLPKFQLKYFYPQFNLPKYRVYTKSELSSIFNSIYYAYIDSNNNNCIKKQFEQFSKLLSV
ncbi:MAG: Eco57I restriction-modification methylase domain-containing protein [Candidatus Hodarchaeota archaeon]